MIDRKIKSSKGQNNNSSEQFNSSVLLIF